MNSKGYQLFFLFLLPLLGTTSVHATPEDNFAFQTFLMVQLRNYSDWVKVSQLEPTPVIPDVVHAVEYWENAWNFTADIWNQVIFNHSNIFSWEVEVDLDKLQLTVYLDYLEFAMIGEYQAKGTFYNETVSGSGISNILAYGGSTLRVTFNTFEITSEGYVDLRKAQVVQRYLGSHRSTFEGLDVGGEENEHRVANMIMNKHNNLFVDWNPLAQYLQNYVQGILDDTLLSDIIGSN